MEHYVFLAAFAVQAIVAKQSRTAGAVIGLLIAAGFLWWFISVDFEVGLFGVIRIAPWLLIAFVSVLFLVNGLVLAGGLRRSPARSHAGQGRGADGPRCLACGSAFIEPAGSGAGKCMNCGASVVLGLRAGEPGADD